MSVSLIAEVQSISYDAVIGYYFAILGVFVTLISLSAALNQEVRQKLMVKYYSRDHITLLYLLFVVSSFAYLLATLIITLSSWRETLIHVTIALFAFSLFFVIYFISNLNRSYFNSLLCARLEKRLKKGKLNSYPIELEDFLSNIGFVQKKNLDFEDEEKAFRIIIEMALKFNSPKLVEIFVNRLQSMDENLFSTFLSSIYRSKFRKNISINEAIVYQTLLKCLIFNAFRNSTHFSSKINTSGLYIKESFDIRLLTTFKETKSLEEINEFGVLATNTVDALYELNELILKLRIPDDIKREYVSTQLSELNKGLDYLNHEHETHFFRQYYDYKFSNPNHDEVKLVDTKMLLIKKLEKYLQSKKEILMFYMLKRIHVGDLSRDFFEFAVKLYSSKGLKEQFVKGSYIDLGFLNYDWFEGGAQALEKFDDMTYRFLLMFNDYLLDENSVLEVQNFSKEYFYNSQSPLSDSVDKLTLDFVNKFLSTGEEKLNHFKVALKSQLTKRANEIGFQEQKYYAESDAQQKYVEQFKKDVSGLWIENQKKLGQIVKVKNIPGGGKIKEYFGRYELYHKEWFLDSFYSNVAKARDAGKWYGKWQVENKNVEIITRIGKSLRKKMTIDRQNFLEEIGKMLSSQRTYYFAFDARKFEIYSLKSLEWIREEFMYAQVKFENGAVLKFLDFRLNDLHVLFEAGGILLNQYQKGYLNHNMPLYVDVSNISDKKEIKAISESKSNPRTEVEVKSLVKIKIAEKFEVDFDKSKFVSKIVFK